MTEYGKLVRDKIPEVIQNDGRTAVVRIATDEECWTALCGKLFEEIKEFTENPSREEYANLKEVMSAIREFKGWFIHDTDSIRFANRSARGGFDQRFILDSASD